MKTKKRTNNNKSPKPSFIEDAQVMTKVVPGPGNYNPHDDVEHIRK